MAVDRFDAMPDGKVSGAMRIRPSYFFGLLIIVCSLVNLPVQAETVSVDDWMEQARELIKQQEKILRKASPETTSADALTSPLKDINQIKNQSQDCIAEAEAGLIKVTEDLQTLGEPTPKENPDVAKKRKSLTQEQKTLDKQLSTCRLLQLQSQDLIKSMNVLQQHILAQQLSARTPHIITVLRENLQEPVAGWQDAIHFLAEQYRLKLLNVQQFSLLVVLMVVSIFVGLLVSRMLRPIQPRHFRPEDMVSAFTLALRTSLARALPVLLPVLVTAAFLSMALPLVPLPFVTKLSYAISAYLGLILLVNVLLSPVAPADVYLTALDRLSRRFAWHLKLFLTLGLFGLFLFTGEFRASLSEPVYYLNRSIFSVLLIINLIIMLWLVRRFSWAILSRKPRILLSLVLMFSLLAELAGYRNLSAFVLGGVLGTSASLAISVLIYRLFKDLFDGLDEGRLDWELRFRKFLGLKDESRVPGLIWLRLILFFVIWGGFAVLVLNIWRLDDPWLGIISGYVTEGFEVGSMTVTPTLLLGGVLAFVVLLSVFRYIRNHILPHGLKHTQLDRGAREAVSSLFGYGGAAIAFLVALSISGVKMENVALIAGALSVGIGFGLQNIVNNFISGLILLFERPIRSGDWIITGDTEGYVKSINIRSTQIQTFDKADVIVPNSELITAKVTNWVLRDPYGRISISIGVGYDSDVEKVHKILLEIAHKHPMVMDKHHGVSPPKVLFMNFGDSALNFELRCFIYDIDQRLNVVSEINFAIIAAFRREGIEIPFPQRVVTMMNKAEDQ